MKRVFPSRSTRRMTFLRPFFRAAATFCCNSSSDPTGLVTYRHDEIARAQPLCSSRAVLRDFGDDGAFCRIGQ